MKALKQNKNSYQEAGDKAAASTVLVSFQKIKFNMILGLTQLFFFGGPVEIQSHHLLWCLVNRWSSGPQVIMCNQ